MASFWGKNTYIPLDIAFVANDGTIIDIKKITPMSTKRVCSTDSCMMAIETNAGFFKKNGITEGDKIDFIKDEKGNEQEALFTNVQDNQFKY